MEDRFCFTAVILIVILLILLVIYFCCLTLSYSITLGVPDIKLNKVGNHFFAPHCLGREITQLVYIEDKAFVKVENERMQ